MPPIPPHADLDQMRNTAAALAKGDERRWGVVRQGLRAKAREVFASGRDE
ncbi:hypothetical protein [Nocardioides montaniterrae]